MTEAKTLFKVSFGADEFETPFVEEVQVIARTQSLITYRTGTQLRKHSNHLDLFFSTRQEADQRRQKLRARKSYKRLAGSCWAQSSPAAPS